MARVTVEDCLSVINNRFELSVLSGFRAKQIARGSLSDIDKNNDKCSVVALREIADKHHDVDSLREAYIYSLRKNVESQDVSEEETSFVETEVAVVKGEKSEVEIEEDDDADDIISIENYGFEDDD